MKEDMKPVEEFVCDKGHMWKSDEYSAEKANRVWHPGGIINALLGTVRWYEYIELTDICPKCGESVSIEKE